MIFDWLLKKIRAKKEGVTYVSSFDDEESIVITVANNGVFNLKISEFPFLGYINIGEELYFFHDVWWILPYHENFILISENSTNVGCVFRYSKLRSNLDKIEKKYVVHLSSMPCILRFHSKKDGFKIITVKDLLFLKKRGCVEDVSSIDEFPASSE
ncbi:hypothetical protein GE253_08860 [Niveispirillum sp. SYP-B3756]|uniref:hypothetical protein n=1 Tax=Niveispirillum sp. SYP-B3756 TaxID=2662178 RepID=UPI0012912E2C|nr:hypothetical protein [Niveispirillum sp. SYP-B3756]MQP65459.1 hypothetical protein [Niveispirillum sp. SYP-B3756]